MILVQLNLWVVECYLSMAHGLRLREWLPSLFLHAQSALLDRELHVIDNTTIWCTDEEIYVGALIHCANLPVGA